MTTPGKTLFEKLDLSKFRRVLVAGDVHGCFQLLRRRLEDLQYNPVTDALILLGDLIDRGPESHKAIDWCRLPNVWRVMGNHEQLCAFAMLGASHFHVINGGQWFQDLKDDHTRRVHHDILLDAPLALEVTTPAGHTVGIVHAAVPKNDWDVLKTRLTKEGAQWDHGPMEEMTWGGPPPGQVAGIDHVFFGHDIKARPVRLYNCSWIDTGAHRNKNLTVLDIDQWLKQTP